MVKRIWTEKEKKDIVELFRKGETFKELQTRYNAHYYTIKRVLEEYDVDTSKKKEMNY